MQRMGSVSPGQPTPKPCCRVIGHDDETWDVSVTFPLAVVAEIVREVDVDR